MWCWRRLLRIPWTARRTHKSEIDEIKTTNQLEALIKKPQLSYFGHIMRSENSSEMSIMLGMGGRTGNIGRPLARWLDDIMAVLNCALTELCCLTRDRDSWRKMIMGHWESPEVGRDLTGQGSKVIALIVYCTLFWLSVGIEAPLSVKLYPRGHYLISWFLLSDRVRVSVGDSTLVLGVTLVLGFVTCYGHVGVNVSLGLN